MNAASSGGEGLGVPTPGTLGASASALMNGAMDLVASLVRSLGSRVLLCATVALSACGHLARTPTPPEGTLVRRDYDQVCRIDLSRWPLFRASEIFDTVGLSAQLASLHMPPLSPDAQTNIRRWQTLDFITRYLRDGRPGAMGVWQTTLDSTEAARVQRILRSRVRPVPSLLEPTGFRTVVRFTPRPTVVTAPAVTCLPHMVHGRNQPPSGLPKGVSTAMGFSTPGPTAVVRIHLDAAGRVTAVDSVYGDGTLVARARAIVAALRFYPALVNGEGRAVAFLQSFTFWGAADQRDVPAPDMRVAPARRAGAPARLIPFPCRANLDGLRCGIAQSMPSA